MPLEAQTPQLDTRTFEQIKRQALLRIPRYTPEWTDFNESDPGITLVELFAWLTEMMLYEMNRAPQRSQIKFLQTLGLELQPAEPAQAHLFFTPAKGVAPQPVPEGSQFGAQPEGGGDLLIFETLEGLSMIALPLSDVQVFDGAAFQVVTSANEEPGPTFRPFGWLPQVGGALYLGFEPDDRIAAADVFPQDMRWRVYLPAAATAGRPLVCDDVGGGQDPAPPVRLSWEYRAEANPGVWRRLQVYEDQTLAFTREGSLHLQGPGPVAQTIEGRVAEARYWLRVRLVEGAYPAGGEPEVDFVRPNVARARNLATVRNEIAGTSDGRPDQGFRLAFRPVAPGTLALAVEDPEQGSEAIPWEQRDDLLASGEDDPHFVLNAVAGEVRFGDGRRGRIPPAGSQIIAQRYQYGGGQAGNVASGAINLPLSALTGVDRVSNPRPAAGGRDEESLEDFLACAPARLRHRNRAVAADDFASLAEDVGGIGKAKAIPLFHPSHPGVEVPGAITLVVVPDNLEIQPLPSPDQIEAVCRYLEPRRLLTTELHVKGPEYMPVRVTATVQVAPYASFDRVAAEIIRAINTSLDPLGRDWGTIAGDATGGVQDQGSGAAAACDVILGGTVGRDLYPTSLYSVIQGVADVRAISYLAVNGQEYDDLRTPIEVPADGLLVGGTEHVIEIQPYTESR
jgi:predicted phage baseplate assembly protein